MTLSVYGWSNGNGGTHHYRIEEPLRSLNLQSGFQCVWGQGMDAHIQSKYDVILAHMPHEPIPTKIWSSLKLGGHNHLVVDVDDYAWGYPKGSGTEDHWTPERLANLESNLMIADLVTTPSCELALYLGRFNSNVIYMPNTVPYWVAHNYRRPSKTRFRIGYQGASQHKLDFTEPIQDALSAFLATHQDAELHLYGFSSDSVFFPPNLQNRVHITPWNENREEYYKSLKFEVGIGPLASHPFNRYKSDIRRREYMAIGALPILQKFGPYDRSGDPYAFTDSATFYKSLQRAYQEWSNYPQWESDSFGRRVYARSNYTTENTAERIGHVYRRFANQPD